MLEHLVTCIQAEQRHTKIVNALFSGRHIGLGDCRLAEIKYHVRQVRLWRVAKEFWEAEIDKL